MKTKHPEMVKYCLACKFYRGTSFRHILHVHAFVCPCFVSMCVCVCIRVVKEYGLWSKLSLHAYEDKFYVHLDSQVRTLEGITFLPNINFIKYKVFGNIYFSCMPYIVFAISSSLCCLGCYHFFVCDETCLLCLECQ